MIERNQTPKRVIKDSIEDLKNMWAQGAFTGRSNEETVIMNIEAVGIVKGLQTALAILDEDLVEDD